MEKIFEYSILKYRHSLLIEESMSIGLLFFFPEEEKIEFHCPTSLSRISHSYPGCDLKGLKLYLNYISKKVSSINKKKKEYFNSLFSPSFEDILKEILVPDDSALYFSIPKPGIYDESDEIVDFYYRSCLNFLNYDLIGDERPVRISFD
jgi:hypothetical protein